MSIFHLAAKTHGRSVGRSAVAAAAYRSGTRLVCDRTGLVHDYRRRRGVVATHIVIPQSETTIDRGVLWNRAELAERRRNSTLAREFEIALPYELDASAREVLATAFARRLADRYGVAVDVAIHEPGGTSDHRNHHAHLLTTTRVVEPDGTFGKKLRILDDWRTGPQEINAIRELWAGMCNGALATVGVTDLIDHRSHEARGIDAVPGRKLGFGATGFESRTGKLSRRRMDHEADAIDAQLFAARADHEEFKRPRDLRPDRKKVLRAVLGQLRDEFAAATEAAIAGRRSSTIDAALAIADGNLRSSQVPGRLVTAKPDRLPAIFVPRFSLGAIPHAAITTGGPAPQAANSKRRHYDEAEEAAAVYRRVDRELDAERMAQLDQEKAEARKAAARISHPPLAVMVSIDRKPIAPRSIRVLKRTDKVAPIARGATRRPVRDDDDERFAPDRSTGMKQEILEADAGPSLIATAMVPMQDGDLRRAALMMAQELARSHRRTRTRLGRLAAAVGMEVAAFEAMAAADEAQDFDPATLAAEPVLADLWADWLREDHDRQQRSRQARADNQPRATEAAPADAADDASSPKSPAEPSELKSEPMSTLAEDRQSPAPYRRRDIVIDAAISLIASGGWKPSLGDALAEELGTRRGWIWKEAHRVARARYDTINLTALPSEARRELLRKAREEADGFKGLRRTMDTILSGKLPASRKL